MVYDQDDTYGEPDIQADVLPAVPGIDSRLFFDRPERFDDVGIRPATAPAVAEVAVAAVQAFSYIGRAGSMITRVSAFLLRAPAASAEPTPSRDDDVDPADLGDVLGLEYALR